jgi:sn-glycerol 3-phosphate transport system ATP-binding protein
VLIDGRDVTDLPPAQRGIAMVFQNYALFPHLSVADNIGFGLSVRKVPAAETASGWPRTAELLGLSPLLDRKPSQLSGGQQQRVALGRALVAQAKVCLMDEPLSNLDAQLRQEMRTELRQLQQRLGLTVVYVTHDQAEAMSMADQVVLLNKGRIEQAATPRELYAPAGHHLRRQLHRHAVDEPAAAGRRPHRRQRRAGAAAPRTGWACGPKRSRWAAGVPATVRSIEYLGADLILHCAVGSETLTVRTGGQADLAAGSEVLLDWHRGPPTTSTPRASRLH